MLCAAPIMPNMSHPGRVIASYGRHATVEGGDGMRMLCKLAGRRLEVVCGDAVLWRKDGDGREGVIEERQPRRSVLSRTDAVGRTEIVVANLTQLLVIVAPRPVPDFFIAD